MRPVFLFLKCWEIGFTFVSSALVFVSGLSLRTSPHLARQPSHQTPNQRRLSAMQEGDEGGPNPAESCYTPSPGPRSPNSVLRPWESRLGSRSPSPSKGASSGGPSPKPGFTMRPKVGGLQPATSFLWTHSLDCGPGPAGALPARALPLHDLTGLTVVFISLSAPRVRCARSPSAPPLRHVYAAAQPTTL